MQIVIDIPDKVYGVLKYFEESMGLADKKDDDDVKTALIRAVVNGTPLPKGRGRLIDADKLWDSYHNLDYDFYEALDLADAIIEADKAERSGEE